MIEAQRRGDEAQLVAGPDVSANPATEPHMSELIAGPFSWAGWRRWPRS
jgi:hypothetical protein